MHTIRIKTFESTKEIKIKDLRNPDHPEYEDFKDIDNHLESAIDQNGLRYYGDRIFNEVYKKELPAKPLSFFKHMYHLVGGAKGVIKYRIKHSKSTFSRYQKFTYESLDILRTLHLQKHKGKVYKAKNGIPRIELIEAINAMCDGIENAKVLECGCGSGLNMYLLNCLNPNLDLHGFEYTNARIASAITNLFYNQISNNLFLGDVCNLNLPDASFDVVYSFHVLEQLGQENAEIAVKEMWRVCKKGLVMIEPSLHEANAYEKWRVKILGYCQDLETVAKDLPNSKIVRYEHAEYKAYPTTSRILIIEKI